MGYGAPPPWTVVGARKRERRVVPGAEESGLATQGQTDAGPPGGLTARIARSLDRHATAWIAGAVAMTALIAVPFVGMQPRATASQEPPGAVFEARDRVAERLPLAVHHMVFVVEARDGNVLDRGSLLELFDHTARLRRDPDVGTKLASWPESAARAAATGVLTIADPVDGVLRALGAGGLPGATDEQIDGVVSALLADRGQGAFGLSRETRLDEETGRWVAPAVLAQVFGDNEALGGGGNDALLGSTDTTKEEYARAVQGLLRGREEHNQVWGLAIDVNLTSTEQGESAGPFIGATLLAVLLLLGLTFRSYWAVAITGFGLGMLMIWLRGISNLVGLKEDQILSIIVPIAMISFGVDFAFHAIGRYREELADGGRSPRSAFVVGLGSVLAALLAATVSDTVAFLSNGVSGIESLVQFAVAASVATLASFVVLGVLAPLALSRVEDRFGIRPRTRSAVWLAAIGGLVASLWAMGTVVVSVFVDPLGGVALLAGQGIFCLALPAVVAARLPPPGVTGGAGKPGPVAGQPVAIGALAIGSVVAEAARRRAVLLPLFALVTAAAVWGASQTAASFDVRDFFSASTDFVTGLDKYDRHGSERSGEPAHIYVEADLGDPRVLARLSRFREEVRHLDTDRLTRGDEGLVRIGGGAVELVDAVLASPPAVAALSAAEGATITDEDGDGVPDTREQLEALLRFASRSGVPLAGPGAATLPPQLVRSMVWLEARSEGAVRPAATRFAIQIPGSRDQAQVDATRALLDPLIAHLETDLRQHNPTARAVLTGGPIVREATLDSILLAFRVSLPVAIVFCLVAVSLFLRSLRYGVVTTVPVVLVAAWLYGLMYVLGYSLNAVTATIGAISVGVGIDFSVHFTMRFREELTRAASREQALRDAGRGTGQALAASALSSAVGFAILAFAPMPLFASYGLLTAVMILMALAAALLVLPSLLLLVTPRPAVAPTGEQADASPG